MKRQKVRSWVSSKGAAICAGVGSFVGGVGQAFAEISVPTFPTADLETAIGAILALVAVAVVGGLIIRSIKKA